MEGMQFGEEHKEFNAPETIKSAAIKYNDEIYTGIVHALAHMELRKTHPDYRGAEEGFLTSSGRFVSRKEAKEIAERAAQLKHLDEHQHRDADESGLDSSHLPH